MKVQEVFDTVVAHLRKQNYRQALNGYSCAYRSASGLKCAVGCLLTDEFYDKYLEGKTARDVCAILSEKGWPFSEHAELLSRMQYVHDRYMESPDKAEWHIKLVANELKLTYTAPPTQLCTQ